MTFFLVLSSLPFPRATGDGVEESADNFAIDKSLAGELFCSKNSGSIVRVFASPAMDSAGFFSLLSGFKEDRILCFGTETSLLARALASIWHSAEPEEAVCSTAIVLVETKESGRILAYFQCL
jgi:hypothetical protein